MIEQKNKRWGFDGLAWIIGTAGVGGIAGIWLEVWAALVIGVSAGVVLGLTRS